MAREMKDIGVEWISKIPDTWQTGRLKALFSFGKGLPITKDNLVEMGIAVISYGQIHSKSNSGVRIQQNLIRFVSEEYMDTNPTSLVHEGDFIFADTSEDLEGCGNCVYVDREQSLFAGYHTIILRAKEKQDNRYWAYLFKSDVWRSQIRSKVFGVKLFSISRKILDTTSVLIPPVDEQLAVADFLDTKCAEIDTILEKIRLSIEEYKKLKQAIITQAVTKGIRGDRPMKDSGIEWIGKIPEDWNIVKMKNIGKCRNGLTYSPDMLVSEEEGTLVLRSSNIRDGKLAFTDNVYVNSVIRADLMVKAGDILICSRNGSRALIGKNALIPEGLNASFGAFMMVFRCQTPKYVQMILNSAVFSYYLGTFLTSTINQLTADNFNNMEIVYCYDELEQKEITDYLDKKCAEIDALIEKKVKMISELEAYKKSLIYEYVTGKKEVCSHVLL